MTKSELHSFYYPHDRVIFTCSDELITKQSMAAECDINNILSQFSKTGIYNHINPQQPQYLELPTDIDFQSSLAIIQAAEDAFASLPSKVREHFHNDPSEFLGGLTEESLRPQLEEWGVFKPRPITQPPVSAAPDARAGKPGPSEGTGG